MNNSAISSLKYCNVIEQIVRDGLCTCCGTCVGLCPTSCLQMVRSDKKGTYYPSLSSYDLCINCGLCVNACPGHSVDFKGLSEKLFPNSPADTLIGHHQSCYLGNATDSTIRYNAASGGVVTALLLYALDTGLIDGALVTRMKKTRPLEPESFIARTRDEVISASKSKYCPVPANIALKEILSSDKNERFAVVGLPCHIQGIQKAESLNPNLKQKIVLHISIFCSHNDSFWRTSSLLSEIGIKDNDISTLNYRGEGWPGSMSIMLKNGKTKKIPYSKMISSHLLWFYALRRCSLCCDLTGELADISCGDAWLPKVTVNEKEGKSIIISRTLKSTLILEKAAKMRYIELSKIYYNMVSQSQDLVKTKKKDLQSRLFIFRLLNKAIPLYNTKLLQPNFYSFLRSFLIFFNIFLSSNRYLRKFTIPLLHFQLSLMSILRD